MPSSSSQPSSTVQRSEPAEFIRPFLERSAIEAERQFDQPREFFPGQTFVDPSQQTLQSLDLLQNRALQGSPVTDAAQQNIVDTLQGNFANPFFQQAFDFQTQPLIENFQENIAPGVNSAFIGAGRSGSPANQQVLGRATDQFGRNLAEVGGNLAFQNFQNERQRQLQAAGISPLIAGQDVANAQLLGQVGQAREGIQGQQLAEDIERFNFGQNVDAQQLRELTSILNASPFGGTVTSEQANFRSPFTAGLGGALGGGVLGTQFGGPIGGGIGAALGGLGGIFF